jgi:hypothetical protein
MLACSLSCRPHERDATSVSSPTSSTALPPTPLTQAASPTFAVRSIAVAYAPRATIASRFELLTLAGKGAMGVVFRARDRLTGETVAVRHVRTDSALETARLTREARVLSELHHPAIVRTSRTARQRRARRGSRWSGLTVKTSRTARHTRSALTLREDPRSQARRDAGEGADPRLRGRYVAK